jgi:hypothetical protein
MAAGSAPAATSSPAAAGTPPPRRPPHRRPARPRHLRLHRGGALAGPRRQALGRFTTALRRALAAHLGVTVRAFPTVARLSYAKVAEYQRRGLVHFHAVIRLDGPDGPTDPPPASLDHAALRAAIAAAASTAITTHRPDGTALVLRWGAQLDVRAVTRTAAAQVEDTDGQISDAALAGYIAKYATKGTGATEGTDRPIRDGEHIAYLDITPHHRRIIETVWAPVPRQSRGEQPLSCADTPAEARVRARPQW